MYITKIDDPEYKRIMKKKLKASGGYCPSELIKSPDTKCPCKTFREQEHEGFCGCGYLYKHLEDEEND